MFYFTSAFHPRIENWLLSSLSDRRSSRWPVGVGARKTSTFTEGWRCPCASWAWLARRPSAAPACVCGTRQGQRAAGRPAGRSEPGRRVSWDSAVAFSQELQRSLSAPMLPQPSSLSPRAPRLARLEGQLCALQALSGQRPRLHLCTLEGEEPSAQCLLWSTVMCCLVPECLLVTSDTRWRWGGGGCSPHSCLGRNAALCSFPRVGISQMGCDGKAGCRCNN